MATKRNSSTKKSSQSVALTFSGRKEELGIGDIVISVLDQVRFQGQHGGGNNNWVLCNGASYPNSRWAQASGNPQVPNLMGRYPRGYQQGLTPAAGQFQEDAVKTHRHLLEGPDMNRWGIMGDAQGGGDNQVARFGYNGHITTSGPSDVLTDVETRPKTTVVNFFIRIN